MTDRRSFLTGLLGALAAAPAAELALAKTETGADTKTATPSWIAAACKALAKQSNGQTIALSPGGLTPLLRMLALGGPLKEETLASELPKSEVDAVATKLAMAVWGRKGGAFTDAFIERTKKVATLGALDFADPKAAAEINAWVAEHTDGMIEKIINGTSGQTELVAASALVFESRWAAPFDPELTESAPFRLASGGSVKASMMRRIDDVAFFGEHLIRLPFAEKGLVAYLAPADQMALSAMATPMKSGEPRVERIDLRVPRLDVAAAADLAPILAQSALKPLMTAPLKHIAPSGPVLSELQHRVRIRLDEQGAKAAAASAAIANRSAIMPRVVAFDAPFHLAIAQDGAPAPLFLATVAAL